MGARLTPYSVFERQYNERTGRWVDTRLFLPTASSVRDIHLIREGGMALVDIPQAYVHHSPDGFEWGYGGSGPADLALNVLGLFVPAPEAWRLHHQYKFAVISRLSREGPHTITAESVRTWIRAQWASDPAGPP